MAGQGKGPLRIAIEDFFTTTKIGVWLAGWFKDWVEAQEAAIATSYANLLGKLDAIAADPLKAIPQAPAPAGPGGQGEALTALTFAGEIGSAAASAFMAPLMRLLNYFIDKKYRTSRLDPSQAIQWMFRMGGLTPQYIDDLRELGWTDQRIQVFIDNMRPILGEQSILELFHRGIISDETANLYFRQLGYNDTHISEIRLLSEQLPGIGELVNMGAKHAWSDAGAALYGWDNDLPGDLITWAEKNGVAPEWVKRYWRAHWDLPGIGNIFDMLHRLRPGVTQTPFTAQDVSLYLSLSGIPSYWHDKVTAMSYSPYSRIDVRRMYKLGILTAADVKSNYLDLGFDEKHAQTLTDFTVKLEDPNGNIKPVAARDLSLGVLKDVYLKHIWTVNQVRDYLKTLAYEPDEVNTIITVWDMAQAAANKDNVQNSYNGKITTDIINAYANALVSLEDGTSLLQGLGYTKDEIATMLNYANFDANRNALNIHIKALGDSYVTRSLSYNQVVAALGTLGVTGRQQGQLFNAWDTQRQYRTRGLSQPEYTKALTTGLISETDYTEYMRGLGFTDDAINLSVQLIGAGLTQAQYTSAFKKGIITEADYRTYLAGLGYSTSDINILVDLNLPTPPKPPKATG
jgi:hypothetical protein